MGLQCLRGIAGDGGIEQQRTVVGDEQCKMWFMVQYVWLHVCGFLAADIWRIGDDDVEMCIDRVSSRIKDVNMLEAYGCVIAFGITPGDGQCIVTYVPCRSCRVGKVQCERDGDAARAGTDVENVGVRFA